MPVLVLLQSLLFYGYALSTFSLTGYTLSGVSLDGLLFLLLGLSYRQVVAVVVVIVIFRIVSILGAIDPSPKWRPKIQIR